MNIEKDFLELGDVMKYIILALKGFMMGIANIIAIVPPLTPGIIFAIPMKKPFKAKIIYFIFTSLY